MATTWYSQKNGSWSNAADTTDVANYYDSVNTIAARIYQNTEV
jgi:hypothetical protein